MPTLRQDVDKAKQLRDALNSAKSPIEAAITYQNFVNDLLMETFAPVPLLTQRVEEDDEHREESRTATG